MPGPGKFSFTIFFKLSSLSEEPIFQVGAFRKAWEFDLSCEYCPGPGKLLLLLPVKYWLLVDIEYLGASAPIPFVTLYIPGPGVLWFGSLLSLLFVPNFQDGAWILFFSFGS